EKLFFPRKSTPVNHDDIPVAFGIYGSFAEVEAAFPPFLSAYLPAFYAERTADEITENDAERDRFLVGMIQIMLIKRLESSWFALRKTVDTILNAHNNALSKITAYENRKTLRATQSAIPGLTDINPEQPELPGMDDDDEPDLNLGKKRKISVAEIDEAGNLAHFKKDLTKDTAALKTLADNLEIYKRKIDAGRGDTPSEDLKLRKLIETIRRKQTSGANGGNKKVLVFTSYTDTAEYLFGELRKRGFTRIAYVSGSLACDDSGYSGKHFENILERFAPKAKGKETEVAAQNNAIDILIATDVLSEGQNLQDADFVVNYDIHWNPVRVIQRVGRIDRLASENREIQIVNFWPEKNVEDEISLRKRVEQRMAAMMLMGSEVLRKFTPSFEAMSVDEELEARHLKRMMEQMKNSLLLYKHARLRFFVSICRIIM
ncbi:MAG: helicase, partial [Kiritimatiellaeota bacterium]|nr:helicase [Kiritimatiellota bacterium]